MRLRGFEQIDEMTPEMWASIHETIRRAKPIIEVDADLFMPEPDLMQLLDDGVCGG